MIADDRKLLVVGLAVSVGLSACSFGRGSGSSGCKDNPRYQATTVEAPLKVPSGLEVPEQAGEMPLPTGPRAAVAAGPGGECLERPPRFFAASASSAEKGLPVARESASIGDDLAPVPSGASGSAPVLISGASVLTNEVAVFLNNWANIWSDRNLEEYFTYYSPDFAPAGYSSHSEWQETQRERFAIQATTEIVLDSLEVETLPNGDAKAKFVQRFGVAPNYRSVLKEMGLTSGGPRGWRITSERILDVL